MYFKNITIKLESSMEIQLHIEENMMSLSLSVVSEPIDFL